MVEFDPLTKTTLTIATDTNKPTARYYGAGGIVDDYLYIFGGYAASATVPTAECYRRNMNTGVWESLALLPVAVDSPVCWVYQNKFHVLGGATSITTQTNLLQIYDITTNVWTSFPYTKIQAQYRCGKAVTNRNSILIFGGLVYNNVKNNNLHEIFLDDLSCMNHGAITTIVARYAADCWYYNDNLYISNGLTTAYQQSLYKIGPFVNQQKFYVDVLVPGKYDIAILREGPKASDYAQTQKVRIKAEWVNATAAQYSLNSILVKNGETLSFDGGDAAKLLAGGTATNLVESSGVLKNVAVQVNATHYYLRFDGVNGISVPTPSLFNTTNNGFYFYARFCVNGIDYNGGTLWTAGDGGTINYGCRLFARLDSSNNTNVITFEYASGGVVRTITLAGRLIAGWNNVMVVCTNSTLATLYVYNASNNTSATAAYRYDEYNPMTAFVIGSDAFGSLAAFSGIVFEFSYRDNYSAAVSYTTSATVYNTTTDFFMGGELSSAFTSMGWYNNGSAKTALSCFSGEVLFPVTQSSSGTNYSLVYANGLYETQEIALTGGYLSSFLASIVGAVSNTTYVKLYEKHTTDGVNWTAYAEIANSTDVNPLLAIPVKRWGFWDTNTLRLQDYFDHTAYSIETRLHNGTEWGAWTQEETRSTIQNVWALPLSNIKNCKYQFRVNFVRARFGGVVRLVFVASKIGNVRAFASESGATNDSLWRSSNDYTKLDGGVIEASSRIIIGDNNIILDGKSEDGAVNAIYVAPDGGPGGGTGFGGVVQDYCKIHSGDIEFYVAGDGMHRKYKALNKAVFNVCSSGDWVVISDENGPVYWKSKPTVMIYPNTTLIYDASNSLQSQTFQCYVEAIEKVAEDSMQWKFKPIMKLSLGSGQNGTTIGAATYSSASDIVYGPEITINGDTKTLQVSCSSVGVKTFITWRNYYLVEARSTFCESWGYPNTSRWLPRSSSSVDNPYPFAFRSYQPSYDEFALQYKLVGSSVWNYAPSLNFTTAENIAAIRLVVGEQQGSGGGSVCSNTEPITRSGYTYSNAGIRIDYISGAFVSGDITTPGTLNYIAIGE